MNNKKRPLLQVALDTLDLNTALKTTRVVQEVIDVIEGGTILCLAEGLSAVRIIKTLYPEKIILADVRVVEAGAIIAKMVFDAGADWISVVISANTSTLKAVAEEAFSRAGDVQVELQDGWSLDQTEEWKEIGIKQLTFHRSRDAEKTGQNWDEKSINTIRQLAGMGFQVSVTGKLAVEDIALFAGVPVYVFVSGRAIRDADNPHTAAIGFLQAIQKTWPE